MTTKSFSAPVLKIALLIVLSLVSVKVWGLECTSEYIELDSQRDINTFQSRYGGGDTCDFVSGFLFVGGHDITNLDGLSALTRVGGTLRIHDTGRLKDLDELENVVSVGSLQIENNDALISTDGLAQLESIERDLGIRSNSALTNIDGLASLTTVGGDLSVYDNDALVNIDSLLGVERLGGGLLIYGNEALTDINGLANLSEIGGGLGIVENAALENIDALAKLPLVEGSVNISRNSTLANIDGLASVTSVADGLWLSDNAMLTNVNGLAKLTRVGNGLEINNNPALVDIDGLASLTQVGFPHDYYQVTRHFSIHNNAVLANIDGLRSLEKSYVRLVIGGNPLLSNLDGLANLSSVHWGLAIYSSAMLTDIDGLDNLTSVSGLLSFNNNRNLKRIRGFANLTTVKGLKVVRNSSLVSLDGLTNLTDIGGNGLSIYENEALIEIDGLANLTRVEGSLSIYKNPSLASIDGLAGLSAVKNGATIRDNNTLGNLDGMASLAQAAELWIYNNALLSNIDGLSRLKRLTGSLFILNNPGLKDIDGLSGLVSVGSLRIAGNHSLAHVDGLASLTSIIGLPTPPSIIWPPPPETWDLHIQGNEALSNVDGLSNLISVRGGVRVSSNASLAFCSGLTALLDTTDDGEPGPGPGDADIPDVNGSVWIEDNLESCNSVEEILHPPLKPPAVIEATDGMFLNFVRVTFDPVPGATVYRVFRCLMGSDSCGLPIGYPKSNHYHDRRVVPGVLYDYRVRACRTTYCGVHSVADSGHASIPPDKPINIRASDGAFADRVQVSWSSVEGASVYRVFRCPDTSPYCGSPIGFPKGTSFYDTKGDPGVVYYYRIKACTTKHCSKFSVLNAGHRSDTPSLQQDNANAFKSPGPDAPIPSLNDFGRWFLLLLTLGIGMASMVQNRPLVSGIEGE